MGAVTYSSGNVIQLLMNEVVAIQLPHTHDLAERYNVKWTPALYVLDADGVQHHDTVGFMPPEEFIPFVLIGIAKSHFDLGHHKMAHEHFERVVEDYPQSMAAPEAVYLRGVTEYKLTDTVEGLVAAYDVLKERYPSSEWTRRAEPYELLRQAA
jgi:hypothetical protein